MGRHLAAILICEQKTILSIFRFQKRNRASSSSGSEEDSIFRPNWIWKNWPVFSRRCWKLKVWCWKKLRRNTKLLCFGFTANTCWRTEKKTAGDWTLLKRTCSLLKFLIEFLEIKKDNCAEKMLHNCTIASSVNNSLLRLPPLPERDFSTHNFLPRILTNQLKKERNAFLLNSKPGRL